MPIEAVIIASMFLSTDILLIVKRWYKGLDLNVWLAPMIGIACALFGAWYYS